MSKIISCLVQPGMLRTCSTVVSTKGIGVVISVGENTFGVFEDQFGTVSQRHASELEMDLTEFTGRAHVDRWIAREVMGVEAAAHLYVTPDGSAGKRHIVVRVRYVTDCWPVGGAMGTAVFTAYDVPALADLDPDDKRLLPDGSSVLAALVRKAIVEHFIAQRGGK